MRMLISYIYCNQGGVTSVVKQRMPVLLRNGWIVDMAFIHDQGGMNDLLSAGVNKIVICGNDLAENVKSLLKDNKYDLHINFDTPALLHAVSKARVIKQVFEIHTPILNTIQTYPSSVLEKYDSIFVPSIWSKETIHSLLPSIDPQLIRVVPNIVDRSIFSREGDCFDIPPSMLWVGKLADYKNWEEAMQVGSAFLYQHPAWSFIAVTGGVYNEECITRMLSVFIGHNQIDRFRWIHNISQKDMAKLYRGIAKNGGFLLSTSKAESFCLIIHEAMRCGVPVISSPTGPIPEIIQDKVSGLLYELGNNAECLEKCNLYLIPEFRDNVISNSEQALAPYDQVALEDLYLQEINRVMAR